MRSSHGILLLPTANCTLYRHTWYVFRRLISFGCLPNLLVSQERGTWDSTKCCYLSVRNNLSIFFLTAWIILFFAICLLHVSVGYCTKAINQELRCRMFSAVRRGADKSLAFPISYFPICSTTKRIFLG
jgi:hypothetical protein